MDDTQAMKLALTEARRCAAWGDVPVGCVIVRGGEVIARGCNRREIDNDPTAHAEIVAIRAAGQVLRHWRLDECTLYVTLEPCCMCAGAMVNARLGRLVYSCDDPKAGAVTTLYQICADARLNHRPEVTAGVLADECSEVLRRFFRKRR